MAAKTTIKMLNEHGLLAVPLYGLDSSATLPRPGSLQMPVADDTAARIH